MNFVYWIIIIILGFLLFLTLLIILGFRLYDFWFKRKDVVICEILLFSGENILRKFVFQKDKTRTIRFKQKDYFCGEGLNDGSLKGYLKYSFNEGNRNPICKRKQEDGSDMILASFFDVDISNYILKKMKKPVSPIMWWVIGAVFIVCFVLVYLYLSKQHPSTVPVVR